MHRPHPRAFHDDVVAVARRGDARIAHVVKNFGIGDSRLRNWLHAADVEDRHRPGATVSEAAELCELRRRSRLVEQEVEVLRPAAVSSFSWVRRGLA